MVIGPRNQNLPKARSEKLRAFLRSETIGNTAGSLTLLDYSSFRQDLPAN